MIPNLLGTNTISPSVTRFRGHRVGVTERSAMLLVAALYAISVSGYPVIGALTDLLGLPPQTLTIPFRASVFLLAVVIAALFSATAWSSRMIALMYCFCGLYLLRLLIDDFGNSLAGADIAWKFFAGVSLMPMIALSTSARHWDDGVVSLLHTVLAMASLLLVLYMGFVYGFERGVLTEETGRLSSESVNPITVGYLSASLMFSMLCVYLASDKKPLWLLFLSMLIVLLSIHGITQAASKGPTVAVLAVMLFFYFKGQVSGWLVLASIAVGSVYAVVAEMPIAVRIGSIQEDASTQDRLEMILDTLDQISASPWFGSAFVELNSGFYPHNQFLEAAMALGIPLGISYLSLCAYAGYLVVRTKIGDNLFLSSCYISALVNSVFSGSIWGNAALWLSLATILSLEQMRTLGTHTKLVQER
jgi:O-antigen ligase